MSNVTAVAAGGSGKGISEAHPDTVMLTDRLLGLAMGEEITYEEMRKFLKHNEWDSVSASRLQSARRRAQSMGDVVTDCIRGVGIRRLNNEGIVKVSRGKFASIGRKARRVGKALACTEYDKLTDAEKVSWNMSMSLTSALVLATKEAKLKQLEAGVRALPDLTRLPVGAVLDIVKG